MRVTGYKKILERCISSLIRRLRIKTAVKDLDTHHLKKSKQGSFQQWFTYIYNLWWFQPLVCIVIVLNFTHVIFDIYFIIHSITEYQKYMIEFAIFFILFYICEAMIKGFSHQSLKHSWDKVDFILSSIAVIEGIIDVILLHFTSLHTIITHCRILIIFRLLKYYHHVVNMFVGLLTLLSSYVSSDLYYAYDTGRGFLFATESVLKNIDMIVDFGPCAKVPIAVCQKNIKEMFDILDEFEKEHPAITIALKSNRGARRILNRVKSVLEHLKSRSLIMPEVVREIKLILFYMTKEVVYAPRSRRVIANIQKILEEVEWISDDLAKDIYENHVIVTFDAGDVIQKEGLNHQCVYIIAKGVVQIVGENSDNFVSQNYYKLPNVDSLLYFQEIRGNNFFEYLTTSQSIGLLGFLQQTPSFTTAVCEKECELIQIDFSLLNEAEEKYGDLLYSMWRYTAMKISLQLLQHDIRYKSFTDEEINLRLQKAILPDMVGVSEWKIPSFVEATVIIQGRVTDVTTQVEYPAPSYVSAMVHHLQFMDNIKRPRIVLLLLLEPKYCLHNITNWVKPADITQLFSGISDKKQKLSLADIKI